MGRLAIKVLAIAAIYPVALLLTVGVDAVFGTEAFLDELIYSSKRRLLVLVMQDWLSSSIVWLPIALVAVFCTATLGSRFCILASLGIGVAVVGFSLSTSILPLMLAFTLAMALVLPALVSTSR